MQTMREMLKGSLARSLSAMGEEDRVAAAWPIACGRSVSERTEFVGFHEGVMRLRVLDEAWMEQIGSMGECLARETGRIAGVPVAKIHLERKAPPARSFGGR